MKALRTGIIGCGRIARRHAAHLSVLEEVQLVGFCDQVLENAVAFSKQYGNDKGQVYSECERMFAELDLDVVYICLPPYAHNSEVELACRYGVHFLIEKPIALTMELAQVMAEQVQLSGVKSQVGFMYRHGEATLWLERYMREAGIAVQGFMSARYSCNSLHSWWWRDRTKSGGQIAEQVIHLLDLARFFLGEPVLVYSMQDNLFHGDVAGYTVEDASATAIRFDTGSIAVIAATNGAIPNRWDYDARVVLPDVTADFDDSNNAVFHHTGKGWPAQTTVAAEKDVYLAETLDLLAAVREDRPTMVPIEEGVRSLNLALAAVRSDELGVPVEIAL